MVDPRRQNQSFPVDKRHTLSYIHHIMVIDWSNEKNEWLKEHRGVCFEHVVLLFEQEKVVDILEHPNQEAYSGQKIAVVMMDDYAYLVPYVQDGDAIFLKTIIPSRKATAKYKGHTK